LLTGDKGRLTAEMIATAINPDDIHRPKTRLVALENTMNKGGGAIYDFKEIIKIAAMCKKNELKLHMDGARLFNALAESQETPADYGALFDTISICFSKGLGAPVGSVLIGTKDAINQAKRVRKAMGGGMRQAGYLAAACTYALDHHLDKIKDDHKRAKTLASAIENLSFVSALYTVQTNIIIIALKPDRSPKIFLQQLEKKGLLAIGFGTGLIRMVTHLDFNNDQMEKAIHIFKSLE
jgi:threonine aldolase